MTAQLTDASLLKTKAYINGEWVDANYGVVLADVVKCSTRMVEAAEGAQKAWSKFTAAERSGLLRCWFNLIVHNQQDLAQILTAEQDKPLAESQEEIAYGANSIGWFAEQAKRVFKDSIPPLDGVEESAIDREGSKYSMDNYMNNKYNCMGGIER